MSNSWSALIRLLPSIDSLVGKIASINENRGTAVLSAVGSGSFSAKITKDSGFVVGDWVLVRDGIITSKIAIPEGSGVEVATEISIAVL